MEHARAVEILVTLMREQWYQKGTEAGRGLNSEISGALRAMRAIHGHKFANTAITEARQKHAKWESEWMGWDNKERPWNS